MLLFVDTETTGKWRFKDSAAHPLQPHLVQLAAILCDPDGSQRQYLNSVISPRDWHIPPEATAIHSITDEYAITFGTDLNAVLANLTEMILQADELQQGLAIAHNMQFDTNVLIKAFNDAGLNPATWGRLRPFCTMRALTPHMKLPFTPNSYGTERYKWPTLDEAYRFAIDHDPTGERHTAMGDAMMTRDIYLQGRENGWWQ